MITPDEFRNNFSDREIVVFARERVQRAGLGDADVEWLTTVGLPVDAAPFLGFGGGETRGLPTVAEYFRLQSRVDSRYRVIGTNGCGDPIVLDVAGGGAIYYLNHDDGFRPIFVNTSVRHLASCLAGYRRMVCETQAANGLGAFLEGKVPSTALERFVSLVQEIDLPAIQRSTMWSDEVVSLKGGQALLE